MGLKWYYKVVRLKRQLGYFAMAKHEPFVGDNVMTEPGDVWFEFGDTEEQALCRLKRSLSDASGAN
jgi:hypothetical protein